MDPIWRNSAPGNRGSQPDEAEDRRRNLLDRILKLTLDLLFREDPRETIQKMGETILELFPVRSLVIFENDNELKAMVPQSIFGYSKERAEQIREKAIYPIDEIQPYEELAQKLGSSSVFYPSEVLDKESERERILTYDMSEIDKPRSSDAAWHAMDRADFALKDRGGKEIGDITITSTTNGKKLDEATIEGLEILASIGSIAIELARLREKEKETAESLEMRANLMSQIIQITSGILVLTDSTELVNRVLELIRELFGFQACALALYNEREGVFRWTAALGYSEAEMKRAFEIEMPKDYVEIALDPEYRIGYLAHFIPAEKMLPEDLQYWFFTEEDYEKALESIQVKRETEDSWHIMDDFTFAIYDREGKTIGIICPDRPANGKIPPRETIEAIEIFVSLMAIALENANLYSETVKGRDEIQVLNRLMFHDLMNYCMAIRGYIELATESKGDMLVGFVEKAIDQIGITGELIERVRKLSEIKSSDHANLIRIDLGRTVKTQASRSAVQSPEKNVKFEFDFKEENAFVMANDLLPDLFHNIYTNAIKFDNRDTVKIDVGLEGVEAKKGSEEKFWRVSIRDYGPGIPDERKETIFLGSIRFAEYERGMGLGLSIVKSLTYLYRGKVWVEDADPGNPDEGSIFNVLLPAA